MQYAWLIWSLILLGIWAVVFVFLKSNESKKEMVKISLLTSALGFTEPLFVPEYWMPPSLFDLALRTGFDIESFIFSFAIGGIVSVVYERAFPIRHEKMSAAEKYAPRHKYHILTLSTAPLIFFTLLIFSNINPIYSAIIAMFGGGLATWYCRPDIKNKMLWSAVMFLAIYFLYFYTLIILYPGYVETVWNLSVISGILILGVPLEELLFAFSFGFLWASVYEHLTWRKLSYNH